MEVVCVRQFYLKGRPIPIVGEVYNRISEIKRSGIKYSELEEFPSDQTGPLKIHAIYFESEAFIPLDQYLDTFLKREVEEIKELESQPV